MTVDVGLVPGKTAKLVVASAAWGDAALAVVAVKQAQVSGRRLAQPARFTGGMVTEDDESKGYEGKAGLDLHPVISVIPGAMA